MQMKPYFINLLNALILIFLGSWGYLASDTPSFTALIPVAIGVILIAITPGFRNGNRLWVHVAVVLTFIVLIGLVKPLLGVIGREDYLGLARVLVMMISSLFAFLIFLKSFINARVN